MTSLSSFMPDFEEVKERSVVKLERIKLSDLVSEDAALNIDIVQDGVTTPAYARVAVIDQERVRGLPPMRVWYTEHDQDIHMLFLVTPSIPVEQRPFANGKTYLAKVFVPNDDWTIEYEVGLRVGIDMVHTPEGTYYLFLFGEKAYREVVAQSDTITNTNPVDRLADIGLADDAIDLYKD